MSERDRPYPDDEPVIGATYPPYPGPGAAAGGSGGDPNAIGVADAPYEDDVYDPGAEWLDEYGDPYDDPYYDDEYFERPPARQPLFYVIIGMAVVLAVLLVFLLFQVLGGGGGNGAPADPAFNVSINQPLANERISVDRDIDVRILAEATEPIRMLQLLVDGDVVDEREFSEEPPDGIYSATLQFRVDEPANYELIARAVSESGATRDSEPVTVFAVEAIDERPSEITGEVISNVNAREGPGDEFEAVRTLTSGDIVTIVGRTRDSQWLLLDDGTWVRRDAINPSESLDLIDVLQPTPTPAAEPTETPEPSPSPSPTPPTNLPDFSPADASLHNNGALLRVSLSNLSSAGYSGPLVVRVSGLARGTIEQVFNVDLAGNGSDSVDFMLDPPNTSGATVQVTIDPAGSVPELSEDNNTATFVLSAPVDPPSLAISSASVQDAVSIVIVNSGGPLSAADVTVQVALGGETTQSSSNISLASGETATFQVARPASSGTATVSVLVNGQEVASSTVVIPDTEQPTATPESESESEAG